MPNRLMIVCLPLFAAGLLAAAEETLRYSGTVQVPGRPGFRLDGELVERDGAFTKVDRYRDSRGRVAVQAETSGRLRPLRVERDVVSYPLSGREERVSGCDGVYRLQWRAGAGAPWREKTLRAAGPALPGSLLTPFAVERFAELQRAGTVSFALLLPARLRSVRFRLVGAGADPEGRRLVRFEPASFLVRAFVKTAWLAFAPTAPPRLVRFSGPLLVLDEEGEPLPGTVEVVYAASGR